MFRQLVERMFGGDAYDELDHDAVREGLERDRAKREPAFDRRDEYEYDHFTDAMEDIRELKRERRHDEVEDLLLWCIDYAEAEAERSVELDGFGAAPPAYYRHLAIVYRKENRYGDEVALLDRYVEFHRQLDDHVGDDLLGRRERARKLAADPS
ncbi:hypothetical protein HZS55_09040 [Halosimplex rubrum]|uniref:Tetratricopeptide repeat protein n=1 Tax=Halosimplex rubrum TaxID=869889 RepID=A0A7D5T536_9EURY|nr:hypothetical protein [Halosimplex rubrum]QLH77429.1 hypothetical protein HZS55_09040 [Halosimplex rubrum]